MILFMQNSFNISTEHVNLIKKYGSHNFNKHISSTHQNDLFFLYTLLVLCLWFEISEILKKVRELKLIIIIKKTQWAEPVSLTRHFVLRKLYTEASICASYQISSNLAKWFRGGFFYWPITNKNCLWRPYIVV